MVSASGEIKGEQSRLRRLLLNLGSTLEETPGEL